MQCRQRLQVIPAQPNTQKRYEMRKGDLLKASSSSAELSEVHLPKSPRKHEPSCPTAGVVGHHTQTVLFLSHHITTTQQREKINRLWCASASSSRRYFFVTHDVRSAIELWEGRMDGRIFAALLDMMNYTGVGRRKWPTFPTFCHECNKILCKSSLLFCVL
ncbi:hypothetical protein L596_004748 [Steinernema carpocapsae]|uniref:Uncharacterized protein n=1 Tax=Steinernema carpocapsae TaxID=34508 RepID=A0A4U8UWX3_STECR|nr:hypothetical protein L596_004748 [Steinernema carpocapsae]